MPNQGSMLSKTLVIGIIILLFGTSVVSSMDNIAKDNPVDYSSLELVCSSEEKISSNSTWYMFILMSGQGPGFYAIYPNGTYKFSEWEGDDFFSGGTWTNDGRYLCCMYENGTLYDIDLETFDACAIGDGGVGLNGLAYNPVTGKLYGASSKDLYEIDMTTGEQTHIGSFGIDNFSSMIAIAFDLDGICYGWDVKFSGNAILYTINLESGEATEVFSLGEPLCYAQDGSFDYEADTLYLVAYYQTGFLAYVDFDAEELVHIDNFEGSVSFTAFAISYEDNEPPVTTHTLEPPEPDGLNGWYVSDLTVTLNATDDMSGVKEIIYYVNGGAWHVIPGSNGKFVLTQDGNDITIRYWAIDNAGNVEPKNTIMPLIDMDQTPPAFTAEDFTYEVVGGNQWQGWDCLFTANATDAMSDMNRVEFYVNDVLQETINGSGPTYQWEFRYPTDLHISIYATAFDNAGNSITCYIEHNRNRQISHNQPKIKQQPLTLLFLRLIDRFPFLEVFLRAMNLLR